MNEYGSASSTSAKKTPIDNRDKGIHGEVELKCGKAGRFRDIAL
jgi:hypothetical protein